LLDENLRHKIKAQQKTYLLVQEYGRKKLKAEIEQVHHQLFTSPKHVSFRARVLGFFKR